jgi:hypothetical protein
MLNIAMSILMAKQNPALCSFPDSYILMYSWKSAWESGCFYTAEIIHEYYRDNYSVKSIDNKIQGNNNKNNNNNNKKYAHTQ